MAGAAAAAGFSASSTLKETGLNDSFVTFSSPFASIAGRVDSDATPPARAAVAEEDEPAEGVRVATSAVESCGVQVLDLLRASGLCARASVRPCTLAPTSKARANMRHDTHKRMRACARAHGIILPRLALSLTSVLAAI